MSEGKEKKQQMSKETFGHLERLENCPKLQEAVCLKEQDIQNPDDSRLLHSYKPEIQPLNWTLHDVTERTYCSSEANSTCCSNSLYEGQPIRRKLFTTSPFISESERRSGTKTRCNNQQQSCTDSNGSPPQRNNYTVNMVFFIRAQTKLVLKSMNSSTSWSADIQPTTTSSADLCIFY